MNKDTGSRRRKQPPHPNRNVCMAARPRLSTMHLRSGAHRARPAEESVSVEPGRHMLSRARAMSFLQTSHFTARSATRRATPPENLARR